MLPKRTYGHSKMCLKEIFRSAEHVLSLYAASVAHPERFCLADAVPAVDPQLVDPQGWDSYWSKSGGNWLYGAIASLYRTLVIKRCLNRAIRRTFPRGAALLHAGCGSGKVDVDLQKTMKITAVDISSAALKLYQRNNPGVFALRHGNILDLPFGDESFDGVYNLGVMEHFTEEEIRKILSEFHRVIKPGGKILFFWPHAQASSVFVMKRVQQLLNWMNKSIQSHPPVISLITSRSHIESVLREAGFNLTHYHFGMRDFFVQAVIVGEKPLRSKD